MAGSSILSAQQKDGVNSRVLGYHLVRSRKLSTTSVMEASGLYRHRAIWRGISVLPQGQQEETGYFWAAIVAIQGSLLSEKFAE
jgi:hypothetical protein